MQTTSTTPLRRGWLAALFAGLVLASNAALASGLQVAPVSLSLKAVQNAGGLWLSNTGDSPVHAQVRVYHWNQASGTEQLVPSRGLVVSPPMLEIQPGERQLIRVIRVDAPPSGTAAAEDAYRLAIDELPIDAQGKKGLQFVLHYSVPVFVEPAGAAPTGPQLQWSLQREGDQVALQVANTGNSHAQLAGLSFVNRSGRRTEINGGLLGYVLPGATMRWTLKQPAANFAGGGTLEARINGAQAAKAISLADRAH
jgi:fimbrial chaperone protein